DDVHADAVGVLLDFPGEGLDVVAAAKAVELLLVDTDDPLLFQRRAPLRAPRAEEGAVPFGAREHQEQLRDAAAEAEDVQLREVLARHLDAEDPERAPPEVVRGRRPKRQRGDLPEVQPAVERRADELPFPDDRLLRVPTDGIRL